MKSIVHQIRKNNNKIVSKTLKTIIAILFVALTSCSKNDDITQSLPPQENPIAISSIGPTTGPKNTQVVLLGQGFSSNASSNVVTLNGKPCIINSSSTTQLNITIPPAAGTGNFKVTVGGFTKESPLFTFIETYTVSIFAGTGVPLFTGGSLLTSTFNFPSDIIIDSSNNIYTIDIGSGKIRKISNTGTVSTLAGAGNGNSDGSGVDGTFSFPQSLAIDSFGNIFVADTGNNKIKKITPNGLVSTFVGAVNGSEGDLNGIGTDARLKFPCGIAIDNSNNIYVSDTNNHKIKKITPTGQITTIAGSTSGRNDGNGIEANFNKPTNLKFDAQGTLIAFDYGNGIIRKISPTNSVTTIPNLNITVSNDIFNSPKLETDKQGNIYVINPFFNRVTKKPPTGDSTIIFGGGSDGFIDGIGINARFNNPRGICIDNNNSTMYVADTFNHRIRKIVID
jgi:IPT/TIG domain/NHL repeat